MRATSPWIIAVVGVVGITVILLFMLVGIEALGSTSAGDDIRTSIAVKKRFQHIHTTASVSEADRGKVLILLYETGQRSSPDPEALDEEMARVGQFAIEEYPKKIREAVQEIWVTRREDKGSGCHSEIHSRTYEMKNELYVKPENPYDIDDENNQ